MTDPLPTAPSTATTPDPASTLLPAEDITTPEAWEQVRRSVAMLPPGAWAMRREQSLQALGTLIGNLRQRPRS